MYIYIYIYIYVYLHLAFGIATPLGARRRAAAKGLQPRAATRHRFTTKDFFQFFLLFFGLRRCNLTSTPNFDGRGIAAIGYNPRVLQLDQKHKK